MFGYQQMIVMIYVILETVKCGEWKMSGAFDGNEVFAISITSGTFGQYGSETSALFIFLKNG
jgi:hypothetical protein